jgi:hypothetical protein
MFWRDFHGISIGFKGRMAHTDRFVQCCIELLNPNCDVLRHWLARDSNDIRRWANGKVIMMHKDRIIWSNELSEIGIARSSGKKLRI